MKKILFILPIVVLLAAACKQQVRVQPEQNQPAQTAQETGGQNGALKLPTDFPPIPGVQGVLKISDDTAKGNLMLVQTDVADAKTGKNITIYLKTKRDFSAFLNKKVTASIQGAPGQFILDDVKEVVDETQNWKTYTSSKYGFEFKYPENLKLTDTGSKVNLNHSTPYENHGDCDMSGDIGTFKSLTDFNISFEVTSENVAKQIDGDYSAGMLKGMWAYSGAEGCGEYIYFFPTGNRTLVVRRAAVQATSGLSTGWQLDKILAIPGAISKEESQKLFDQILSAFKFTK